jgi:hypothetical protein
MFFSALLKGLSQEMDLAFEDIFYVLHYNAKRTLLTQRKLALTAINKLFAL